MYKSKKLPLSISLNRMKSVHNYFIFNTDVYMNLQPYTLYKICGLDYFYEGHTMVKSVWLGEENDVFGDQEPLIYNAKTNEWQKIISLETTNFVGDVSKMDYNYVFTNYSDYVEVDVNQLEGWLYFNVKKYMEDKYHHTITFNKFTAKVNGTAKEVLFKHLKDYRDKYDDMNDKFLFYDVQAFRSFVYYLDAEIKNTVIASDFGEIYDKVQANLITKEEFLKLI